ncbi:alcohol dehydrogenase catalytic domain-containing protein [Conservatibacter flavescens]|uniref:Galactitol-1-phosphate 5-dehydrogenase n=1 Tax=Conservatibacter flavescens TaxID=28161 RepID=A0A2M8RZI9_9PAST|nr:alcohol dehydrogenase catalytic domain-containing protein [Conservatibacter flavescens]PJG84310.1 galactitol-1-phosphate 5-dehydrogenase [Conservatibacter flavescens]
MKAVVIESNNNPVVREVETPAIIESEDVLVKVLYSGVCGSDIPRIFHNGAHNYPIILGHEFSGVIVGKGSAVQNLEINDLVVCAPLLPCFHCPECEKGFYSLCKNYTFVGSRRAGGNAEYICVNQKNLVKIDRTSDPLYSAFIEPITVGLHAIYLANGCENKNVIVIGAGTIGLLAAQAAKGLGAKTVSVIDINEEKLALAKTLGADFVFNSGRQSAAEIAEQLNDLRFEQLVLETAGVPQTVSLSIEIAGPRSQVALVGTLHHDLTLNQTVFGLILRKELAILGSWMNYSKPWPGGEWTLAMELINTGKINIPPLIASVDEFDGYVQAVKKLEGKSMNGKIVLKAH